MTFSQSSQSSLSYIEEVTFGTTPAGDFTPLPFSTHSLDGTKEVVEGTDIRGDRQNHVERHGNKQTAGDIVADLRGGAYDALFESAMFSTWDDTPALNDELIVGSTQKSFTFEDAANDIGQYTLYTGSIVNSIAVSIAPNQMVTTTFGIIGKDFSNSAVGKTVSAYTETEPFDSYSGTISIGDSGGPLTANGTIMSVDFTLDNGLTHAFVVGSDSAPQINNAKAAVTGTISAYFEDALFIDRFINELESGLIVTVSDPAATSTYGFEFPRIKVNSATHSVDGGPRMVSMDFKALYDSTEGTTLKITRPASD